MGILAPVSEQFTKLPPHAMVLVDLKELSTGAHKLLSPGTRLAVTLQGGEPLGKLDLLKNVETIMLLLNLPQLEDKVTRFHASRRLFDYLQENSLNFPVIHYLQFPKGTHRDDLVITAGSKAGALLIDGLGDGL